MGRRLLLGGVKLVLTGAYLSALSRDSYREESVVAVKRVLADTRSSLEDHPEA